MKQLFLLATILLSIHLFSQEKVSDTIQSSSLEDSISEFQKFRLNGSFGRTFSSDSRFNFNSYFVKSGFGFKINKHFWVNTDFFGMRYGVSREGLIFTNWTFAPNISKDFDFGKIKLIGSVGLFYTLEEVKSSNYERSTSDAGAILGVKCYYEVYKNMYLGFDFSGIAYYYMDMDVFMFGPSIEFRL